MGEVPHYDLFEMAEVLSQQSRSVFLNADLLYEKLNRLDPDFDLDRLFEVDPTEQSIPSVITSFLLSNVEFIIEIANIANFIRDWCYSSKHVLYHMADSTFELNISWNLTYTVYFCSLFSNLVKILVFIQKTPKIYSIIRGLIILKERNLMKPATLSNSADLDCSQLNSFYRSVKDKPFNFVIEHMERGIENKPDISSKFMFLFADIAQLLIKTLAEWAFTEWDKFNISHVSPNIGPTVDHTFMLHISLFRETIVMYFLCFPHVIKSNSANNLSRFFMEALSESREVRITRHTSVDILKYAKYACVENSNALRDQIEAKVSAHKRRMNQLMFLIDRNVDFISFFKEVSGLYVNNIFALASFGLYEFNRCIDNDLDIYSKASKTSVKLLCSISNALKTIVEISGDIKKVYTLNISGVDREILKHLIDSFGSVNDEEIGAILEISKHIYESLEQVAVNNCGEDECYDFVGLITTIGKLIFRYNISPKMATASFLHPFIQHMEVISSHASLIHSPTSLFVRLSHARNIFLRLDYILDLLEEDIVTPDQVGEILCFLDMFHVQSDKSTREYIQKNLSDYIRSSISQEEDDIVAKSWQLRTMINILGAKKDKVELIGMFVDSFRDSLIKTSRRKSDSDKVKNKNNRKKKDARAAITGKKIDVKLALKADIISKTVSAISGVFSTLDSFFPFHVFRFFSENSVRISRFISLKEFFDEPAFDNAGHFVKSLTKLFNNFLKSDYVYNIYTKCFIEQNGEPTLYTYENFYKMIELFGPSASFHLIRILNCRAWTHIVKVFKIYDKSKGTGNRDRKSKRSEVFQIVISLACVMMCKKIIKEATAEVLNIYCPGAAESLLGEQRGEADLLIRELFSARETPILHEYAKRSNTLKKIDLPDFFEFLAESLKSSHVESFNNITGSMVQNLHIYPLGVCTLGKNLSQDYYFDTNSCMHSFYSKASSVANDLNQGSGRSSAVLIVCDLFRFYISDFKYSLLEEYISQEEISAAYRKLTGSRRNRHSLFS